MKTCRDCGRNKPLSDYYAHPQMRDGHLNKCKDCVKDRVHKHRLQNVDAIRAYDRSRGSRMTVDYQRKYRATNPEKEKAHRKVHHAIKTGKLKKKLCERCGSEKVHGHHDDYSKPLDVMWLCPAHHKERHQELKEIN